jgi:hypothetical protein
MITEKQGALISKIKLDSQRIIDTNKSRRKQRGT